MDKCGDPGPREGHLLGDLGHWPEQGRPLGWIAKKECLPTSPQINTSEVNASSSHSKAWDTWGHNQGVLNQTSQEIRCSDGFLQHLRKARETLKQMGQVLRKEQGLQESQPGATERRVLAPEELDSGANTKPPIPQGALRCIS